MRAIFGHPFEEEKEEKYKVDDAPNAVNHQLARCFGGCGRVTKLRPCVLGGFIN